MLSSRLIFILLCGCVRSEIVRGEQETKRERNAEVAHNDYVTPEDLHAALTSGKSTFCILDAEYDYTTVTENSEGLQAFEKEHIPTAHHFNIAKVVTKSETQVMNLVHPLVFQAYVRRLGIDTDCHVVIYDHANIMATTYSWWLFKIYGHEKVSILNGGIDLWKAKKFQTASGEEPNSKIYHDFLAKWDPHWIITFDDVVRNLEDPTYLLVDVRSEEQFEGKEISSGAEYGGHIRGAINLPYTHLLTDGGYLKNESELDTVLRNHGIDGRKPVIVYCNVAMSASIVYFAAMQCDVQGKLYDGSWYEWSFRAPRNLSEPQA